MAGGGNENQFVRVDRCCLYAWITHLAFHEAEIRSPIAQESRNLRRVADRERYGYAWVCHLELMQVSGQPIVADGLACGDMDGATPQSGKVSQYMLSGFRPSEHGFRFCKKRMARACQYDASADAVK